MGIRGSPTREVFCEDVPLTGTDVIGKVDHASRGTDREHVVVDTAVWTFGQKRLIPAGVINRIDAFSKNRLPQRDKRASEGRTGLAGIATRSRATPTPITTVRTAGSTTMCSMRSSAGDGDL